MSNRFKFEYTTEQIVKYEHEVKLLGRIFTYTTGAKKMNDGFVLDFINRVTCIRVMGDELDFLERSENYGHLSLFYTIGLDAEDKDVMKKTLEFTQHEEDKDRIHKAIVYLFNKHHGKAS